MNIEELKSGINAYDEEVERLRDFLSEKKSQYDFEREFTDSWPPKMRQAGLPGAGIVLGWGGNYGGKSWWLDLLLHMVAVGYVEQTKEDEVLYYQVKV